MPVVFPGSIPRRENVRKLDRYHETLWRGAKSMDMRMEVGFGVRVGAALAGAEDSRHRTVDADTSATYIVSCLELMFNDSGLRYASRLP